MGRQVMKRIGLMHLPKVAVGGLIVVTYFAHPVRGAEPSYARDIRPLLAAKCLACHGSDEEARQADLRLDQRDSAVDSGAIAPGAPDRSELIRRIQSTDPDERMPPPDAGDALTAEQQSLLANWIAKGAEYETHWAFLPPQTPQPPGTRFETRVRNEIDRFVYHRLEQQGLEPSPEADPHTLVRRLYLDLIGLPPTPQQADEFVNSSDPEAYERLVDRLLASRQYGERWARPWLDLARYADTNGYEKDRPRSIWPYRDWVIQALNDDMPYDQFTIEQLAGDMLPDATQSQRIATGFHRNTMLNEEGGIDPLEYRFYALVDRVATTGTVWLGLTTGCAQCHSHKYDPISHTDYYSLMALLNNADEPDLSVSVPELNEQRQELERQIAALVSRLPEQFPAEPGEAPLAQRRRTAFEDAFERWVKAERATAIRWHVLRPSRMTTNLPRLELLADGSVYSSGDVTKRDVFTLSIPIEPAQLPITALRLEVLPDPRLPAGGPGRAYYEGRKGDFFLSEFTLQQAGQTIEFKSASHSYGKISVGSGQPLATNVFDGDGSTGWSTSGQEGQANQLVLNLKTPLTQAGEVTVEMLFERHFVASLGRFRLAATSSSKDVVARKRPVEIEQRLAQPETDWDDADRKQLREYFASTAPELAEARKPIEQLRQRMPEFPQTMVMLERSRDHQRPTFRHHRGEYLSPREPVQPRIPAIFAAANQAAPTNRLEFARWLVSPANPLAARVAVNRAWQAFFGIGIVASIGDFGTQSESPSHPQLLDWLATRFVADGWSMKQLHRRIVTSAVYRQSAVVSDELVRRDPRNRLLARGPRFRLPAETIRDSMLQASGLLNRKSFGPSVYPPQPASVTALAYGGTKWPVSKGPDRYRRSLYTFSKRTAPFAAYLVFDGPTGESCVARRNRSNTPLQALTLLNDEMFLEMSRALAESAYRQHPKTPADCATNIFRRLVTRPPEESELQRMLEFQAAQRKRLENGQLDAEQIGGGSQTSPELASWMMLARAVMNLDEAVTKP